MEQSALPADSKLEHDETSTYDVSTCGERHLVYTLGSSWLLSSLVVSGLISVAQVV